MVRVHAGRVVAAMQNGDVVSELPLVHHPRGSMGQDVLPVRAEQLPVWIIPRACSDELPATRVLFLHLNPEALFERASEPWADLVVRVAEPLEALVVAVTQAASLGFLLAIVRAAYSHTSIVIECSLPIGAFSLKDAACYELNDGVNRERRLGQQ